MVFTPNSRNGGRINTGRDIDGSGGGKANKDHAIIALWADEMDIAQVVRWSQSLSDCFESRQREALVAITLGRNIVGMPLRPVAVESKLIAEDGMPFHSVYLLSPWLVTEFGIGREYDIFHGLLHARRVTHSHRSHPQDLLSRGA